MFSLELCPCREKKGKAAASKGSGADKAQTEHPKPAGQLDIKEVDAKLSFGRIEIDKGEVMFLISMDHC